MLCSLDLKSTPLAPVGKKTHPRFAKGAFHTAFLDEEFEMDSPDGHPDEQTALLVAAVLSHLKKRRPAAVGQTAGGGSGWRAAGKERLLGDRTMAQRRGWRQRIG